MGNISAILKSKNILLAIGLVILIFLVIFLGSIIRITWLMRIAIVVFIIMIFIIVLLFKKMKEAQKAGQLEQSMSSSSDSYIISPEKRAEIDQFKVQIEAAIAALKNSKLGRGKSGKAALYKLPWYMIIGPSAAGKTTAIQNSGLEFPYSKDSIKGIGGTRNCDWFFSTRAIFLDTAGRYISESEDRPEWLAFLETLKKNRKKKPINGVIIALNVDEIIKCENNQLYEHAKNIRRRLDELIENLGIIFPVYFVFTKCDLIQGFVEFFGDFSETERSQIWGATLNIQEQLNSDPKSVFENEFNKLADVIHKARTIRLSNPLKREQRRKVFLFPFQFRSLREKLIYLIGEVFQPNPYQDNPLFRGFYFTSGTQEGLPLDLAIREIAKQFNLPQTYGEEFEEVVETKNYFIKDLLNDIVIGDQNYSISQTATVVKQNKFSRLVTISASAILFFITILLFILSYSGSTEALNNIASDAKSFSEINWSGDLLHNFTEVESFRLTLLRIKKGEYNESIGGFGLDRTTNTLEDLTNLYLRKTESFFQNNIYDDIVIFLENYTRGQQQSGEQVVYNYLKAYLLIGQERARLDTINEKFLSGVFTGILNSKFIDSNPIASQQNKDSLKNLFRRYSSHISSQMQNSEIYSRNSDVGLLSKVRLKFQNKPSAESLYALLKENGISEFPELTLKDLTQGKSEYPMQSDIKIPFIFSVNGWKEYFLPAIVEKSKNPSAEDWVIGKTNFAQTSHVEINGEQLKGQLIEIYTKDFIQTWIQLLQNIKYSGFESVPYAANSLKLLSHPVESPLITILNVFSEQLRAISDSQVYPDTNISNLQGLALLNNADIKRIRKFIAGSDDSSIQPEFNTVITQYALLSRGLENMNGEPEIIKDYAIKLMNQQALEFQNAFQTVSAAVITIPELQNLFTEPIKLSMRTVLSGTTSFLNQQWKIKVVDVFNKTLANTFPFSEGGSDAPIKDFEDFFRPNDGILWYFFNTELSSYIKKENWRVILSGNEGLSFSKEFINALRKADEISSTLFRGGNLNFSFRLKPQQPKYKEVTEKEAKVIQYNLKIDGIDESYRMGFPYETSYSWPRETGSPGTALSIIVQESGVNEPSTSEPKKFDGEWALFRLFNEAIKTSGETSSQLVLYWNFSKLNRYNVDISYVLSTGTSKHPFSQNFFKSFKPPNTLN